MFNITVKNMLKDKTITISLIVGFLLSIALVSSIPMYTGGILNGLLHDSLINYSAKSGTTGEEDDSKAEDSIQNTNTYPAVISASYNASTVLNPNYEQFLSTYKDNEQYFLNLTKRINVPLYAKKNILTLNDTYFPYRDVNGQVKHGKCSIVSVTDFTKHVKLIKGKMPKDKVYDDKIADVIVDDSTFKNLGMELGKVYEIISYGNNKPLKVKISGVYKIDDKDNFWADKDTDFYCQLVATENTFLDILKKDSYYITCLGVVKYKLVYDYNGINYRNVDNIYNNLNSILNIFENRTDFRADCPLVKSLSGFIENQSLYVTLIWIFAMPILIVILFYIYMLSGFVVDSDKEQIAVLKSRGVSLYEILRIYGYEGLLICGIGILIGPFIGFYICKALGHITGFLKFDFNLEAAKFCLSTQAYIYSFAAAAVMLATLLISVFLASKSTIVEFKRSKNKYLKSILNSKNLDFVFLAISAYGYYEYSKYKNISAFSGSNQVPIDPILYIISVVFIIGFGMFILRIYRYLVKLIYTISKKFMATRYYLAIINVLRYHLDKSIIMLFVIMTISLGIFDVKVAKNIDLSSENTIKYSVGADLTIQQAWKMTEDKTYNDPFKDGGRLFIYTEPYNVSQLSKVKGIESYTKVLNVQKIGQVDRGQGNSLTRTSIMGIIPSEFGKIAWFDSNLLNYHWYYYLNALTKNRNAVLISTALSQSANIGKGDTIFYRIGDGLYVSGVVIDILDYWPGCIDMKNQNQIIGNFYYIFDSIPKYPYEIWMKKDPKVSNQVIYDSINSQKLNIASYKDSSSELYKGQKDIFLKGTNAILSLGLISVAVVTIIAFMLYWVKSLKNRKLSFGVYRSLGIPENEVYKVLAIEQVFTLGVSILFGIADGTITCKLFLPIIVNLWHNGRFVVPVNVISYMKEYLSLGILLIIVFLVSLVMLIKYISKLKINEAIKLGDD